MDLAGKCTSLQSPSVVAEGFPLAESQKPLRSDRAAMCQPRCGWLTPLLELPFKCCFTYLHSAWYKQRHLKKARAEAATVRSHFAYNRQ